jgi:cell division protein FtsL
MTAKANPRNHRNNPYVLDGLAVQVHHSAAGTLWRFRTELAILTVATGDFLFLDRAMSLLLAAVIVAALAVVLMAVPWSRRFITRRAWCVLSRHRIQRVFYETRMHTRSGRLPLVLRIRPTEVGERALIWCRAGICFEDFEAHTGEIAAACYAREARVEKSKHRAQLVVVNIVRRDTLAAHHVVASGLASPMPRARGKDDPAAA